MKYTLDLLPVGAFQGRKTPIGGHSLRLHGGGDGGYYDPNWFANTYSDYAAVNPEYSAPEPSWSPPPEAPIAVFNDPAPIGGAPAAPPDSGGVVDPGFALQAPVNPWEQTVNDIYQQTFGRQADPSGMASFTAALNQGMTGEQMRAALASSPEGQALKGTGVDPGFAIISGKTPQWEWQPGQYDDQGNYTAPYFLDINSGNRRSADPIQGTGVNTVDVNSLPYHVAPNYEGTPTQFYDAQGSLKGVLVDMVGRGGNGQYIVDPNSLGLALKPGEKPSVKSEIQERDAQGQLLFIDPTTGDKTIYNTGIPSTTGQTVANMMYIRDPGNRGGIIPKDVYQGLTNLALAMISGGVGGALLEGLGASAGALSSIGEGALSTGSTIADAAIKSALTKAATSALSGSDLSGILAAAGKGALTSFGSSALGSIDTPIDTGSGDSGDFGDTGEGGDDSSFDEGFQRKAITSEPPPNMSSESGPISVEWHDPNAVEPPINIDQGDVSTNDSIDQFSTYQDIPFRPVISNTDIEHLFESGLSADSISSLIDIISSSGGSTGIGSSGGTSTFDGESPFIPPGGGLPSTPPSDLPVTPPSELPTEPSIDIPIDSSEEPTSPLSDEETKKSQKSKKKKITQPQKKYLLVAQEGNYGALPSNLQGTFLQGVNVKEYNPFENYNVYQQLAPVHAAEGGSPLQLAQMQQGIYGVDPRLYSVLQKRQAPNYFTYGADTSGGNPTTFAGSQLMGKPFPVIPLTPTGKPLGGDWLYKGSGSNPLAMAGTGISNLPSGMMAEGGQAHGEGEHIPEFITGATGHYVKGRGDGQSDDIPAMLADGEFVFDSSSVSTLGNGSSDAGAKLLDAFRESLREHTRSAPKDKIPPKASPLQYMKEAMQKVGMK